MKCIFLSFLVSGFLISESEAESYQKLNRMAGDLGYLLLEGKFADEKTDELILIRSHLLFAEMAIRNQEIAGMTTDRKQKREELMDHLSVYTHSMRFPSNYDHPGKKIPCFIDKTGNICAVGYLIEKSAGRQIAEKINQKHQYSYLLEMNDPLVDEWIDQSGLTEQECAMIQPGYSYKTEPGPDPVLPKQINPELVKGDTVLRVVDQVALFPGDTVYNGSALHDFTNKNIKYPEMARETGIQGTVYVEFIVRKDGTVIQPKIIKSVEPSIDKETLRVVKLFPKWIPAKISGVPVDSYVTIPVKFKLI
ncbi:MAG: energy transducer TonB [Bacteroidota bacterium]